MLQFLEEVFFIFYEFIESHASSMILLLPQASNIFFLVHSAYK